MGNLDPMATTLVTPIFKDSPSAIRLQAAVRGYAVRSLIVRFRNSVAAGFLSVAAAKCQCGDAAETADLRVALWFQAASFESDLNLQEEDDAARRIQALIKGRMARRSRAPSAKDPVEAALKAIQDDESNPMLSTPLLAAAKGLKDLPPMGSFSDRSSSLYGPAFATVHSG